MLRYAISILASILGALTGIAFVITTVVGMAGLARAWFVERIDPSNVGSYISSVKAAFVFGAVSLVVSAISFGYSMFLDREDRQ